MCRFPKEKCAIGDCNEFRAMIISNYLNQCNTKQIQPRPDHIVLIPVKYNK